MSDAGSKLPLKKGQARGLKFVLLQSLFNRRFSDRLLMHSKARLKSLGAMERDLRIETVPGAFELPLVARELAATRRYDAVICLGAVLRGDTSHYDLVCESAAQGILSASLETGVPISFGVITCDNEAQALQRSSGGAKDSGIHAAEAAVHMALLVARIRGGN